MNEILEFRLERLFQAYRNEDDCLTYDSFVAQVPELAARRGESPLAPHYQALLESLGGFWDSVVQVADTDGDGVVERDEFRVWAEAMQAVLQEAERTGAPWPLEGWVDALIAVMDADGDGSIDVHEYRDWLDILHLSDGMDVEAVFDSFDKSHDGLLSRDEFAAVVRDYWSNFDDSIAAHQWLGG